MTTSAKNKQTVKADWPIQKIQEEITKTIASKIVSRLTMLEEDQEAAVEQHEKISAEQVAEGFKKCGVKTPLDLVKHMAEHEANLFGAQVEYAGDDKSATLFNLKPTMWLEAKKMAKMTSEQEQMMHEQYENWQENLAEALGFTAEVEITNNGNSSQITFSKKGSK